MNEDSGPLPSFDAHLHVRLSRPLLATIKEAARQDRRTLSSYVRDRLARVAREDRAGTGETASAH